MQGKQGRPYPEDDDAATAGYGVPLICAPQRPSSCPRRLTTVATGGDSIALPWLDAVVAGRRAD